MFTNKLLKSCVVVAFVMQATDALAQGRPGEWPRQFYGPVSPLPPELYFSHDHASTALEGALRGRAQLIHATGSYWLAMSQSLICREEARCLAQANRERRIAWCQLYRSDLAQRRQASIEKRRVVNDAARPASYEVYRLTAKQLDRTTGEIAWPKALLTDQYEEVQLRLDDLFREEARGAGSLANRAAEVVKLVQTIADNLRRRRLNFESAEYLATQKFLCGVKLEAMYPFDAVGDEMTRTAASSPSSNQGSPPWKSN